MPERPTAGANWRLPVAVAGTLLLSAIVVIVILSENKETLAATPPPLGCLERWNADPAALRYGRHNYTAHLYTGAQVRLLDESGEESGAKRGRCAVVFPAPGLDPEPFFSGQIYADERWGPLAKLHGLPDVRLAELQVEAQAGANALLRPDGTLVLG